MKKSLITGGAGFIGVHLANHLLDLGEQVEIVDNFFRAKKDEDFQNLLQRPRVRFIEADLTQQKEWNKLGSDYDYVYHLAAVNGTDLFYKMPAEVLRINILTAIYVLDWFKEKNPNGKIMFTSSNEAYAGALEAFDKLPIPTPEDVPLVISDVFNPRWSYAGSKLVGEQLFIHYAKQYNLKMSIVRPHNFYGPRAGFNHVIPQFIERIVKKNDPFPIYGNEDTRTFCYISDAIEAMRMVMESDKTDGQTYHIGATNETKIGDLAKIIFKLMNWLPKKLDIHSSPVGSVSRRLADISKIKKDVNWKPTTSLEQGLNKTIEWYQNFYEK